MIVPVRLTDDLFVSRQPQPEEFAELKALGIRAVINNRTDGESGTPYPQSAEARRLAEAQGLAYAHLPVQGAQLGDPDITEGFAKLLDSLPKPILAHCGGGTRSTVLWALAAAPHKPVEDIMATAAAAGYDLTRFRELIAARAGAGGAAPDQS